MGGWKVLFLFCGGHFGKEWHSGISEMVGRVVDSLLVVAGYPHIEEGSGWFGVMYPALPK